MIVLMPTAALADDGGPSCSPSPCTLLGGGPGTAVFLGLLGDVAWFALDAKVLPITAPQRVDLRRAAASWRGGGRRIRLRARHAALVHRTHSLVPAVAPSNSNAPATSPTARNAATTSIRASIP